MIDPKFTQKIAQWLQSDHKDEKQIQEGAMILLQLNRDRAMYQRIIRRPQRELSFLEYKLRRFLQLRQDGRSIKDVVRIDQEITPEIGMAVTSDAFMSDAGKLPVLLPAKHEGDTGCVVRKGIRPDHDKLPANIQAIWTKNAERWKKIKEAYETCKKLTEPCDRYEFLPVLKDTWYKYKEEMARYDDFVLTDDGTDSRKAAPSLTPEQEKELSNADSYISKNMAQMLQLVASSKDDHFNEDQKRQMESLRKRIQQRVDVLLKYGRTLTWIRRDELIECGIKV